MTSSCRAWMNCNLTSSPAAPKGPVNSPWPEHRFTSKQDSGHVELTLTFGAAGDDVRLQFIHALETSQQFSEVQIRSDVTPTTVNGPNNDQRVVQLSTYYSGT